MALPFYATSVRLGNESTGPTNVVIAAGNGSPPSSAPDGGSWTPGSEWHASDTGYLYVYNGTLWINISAPVINPYIISFSYIGQPTASQVFYRAITGLVVTFPVGLTGSSIQCRVAPTNDWVSNIKKNGSIIGTGTISAGNTTGSFSFVSQVVTATTDIIELDAPSSTDVTITDISVVLAGSR